MKPIGTELIRQLQSTTTGVRHGGRQQSRHTEESRCSKRWFFCTPTRNHTAYIYIHTHTHHNLTYVYIVLCFQREENLEMAGKRGKVEEEKNGTARVCGLKKMLGFLLLFIYIYTKTMSF